MQKSTSVFQEARISNIRLLRDLISLTIMETTLVLTGAWDGEKRELLAPRFTR